jgi:hypothetical protein
MEKIVGMEGLTGEELARELQRGGKFVYYMYAVSIVVLTFRRNSAIHFIRSGENAAGRGARYSLISLFLGWWGIPWGPIYTVQSLNKNAQGGVDVTQEVLAALTAGTGRA